MRLAKGAMDPGADITEEGEDQAAACGGRDKTLMEEVVDLHHKGEANKLISLISTSGGDKARTWDPLLLWVRPQRCCLDALAAHLRAANVTALASVGCGTGLLEWLIQATTGLSVMGYEVNAEWWTSKYAPPTFIPLTYVDPDDATPKVPPTHALMCCYFNDGAAFRQYVAAYDGPALLIIGSTGGQRHTDPHPLDYVDKAPWRLTHTHRIAPHDLLACYLRHPTPPLPHTHTRR